MAAIRIRDLAHLTQLAAAREDGVECSILLAGGAARSRKTVRWLPPYGQWRTGRFEVVNHIDDTAQVLWPSQLWTQSNIGAALDAGALVAEA